MSKETIVGECPVCGVNVHDRGSLNRSFKPVGKARFIKGYPSEIAMPCGINHPTDGHCPFETDEEQKKNFDKYMNSPKISGKNTYD